jgi:hypothetical protein
MCLALQQAKKNKMNMVCFALDKADKKHEKKERTKMKNRFIFSGLNVKNKKIKYKIRR